MKPMSCIANWRPMPALPAGASQVAALVSEAASIYNGHAAPWKPAGGGR